MTFPSIGIDIGIAKRPFQVLVLILILQNDFFRYWYRYWYCKMTLPNIGFYIGVVNENYFGIIGLGGVIHGEKWQNCRYFNLKQVSFPYFSNNIANKIVVKRIFC